MVNAVVVVETLLTNGLSQVSDNTEKHTSDESRVNHLSMRITWWYTGCGSTVDQGILVQKESAGARGCVPASKFRNLSKGSPVSSVRVVLAFPVRAILRVVVRVRVTFLHHVRVVVLGKCGSGGLVSLVWCGVVWCGGQYSVLTGCG